MTSYGPLRLVALLALAALSVGCQPSVFFPRRPPPTAGQAFHAALLSGLLTVRAGCVWIVTDNTDFLVVWPNSYMPANQDGQLVILDGQRTVVARAGQVVTVGGGEVAVSALEAEHAVQELAGTRIPRSCAVEAVWNAGGVIEAGP